MKITLTQDEVNAIVKAYFNMSSKFDLEIVTNDLKKSFLEWAKSFSSKIDSVKYIRSVTDLGLKDSVIFYDSLQSPGGPDRFLSYEIKHPEAV